MEKILLIVDLETQYYTSDDFMGLLDDSVWTSTKKQIENQYKKISREVKKFKESGWTIYFTGQTAPYEGLNGLIDHTLPYWFENQEIIKNAFPEQRVAICGIFLERCVRSVHELIPNSYVIKKMTVSHGIIGDIPHYGIEEMRIA